MVTGRELTCVAVNNMCMCLIMHPSMPCVRCRAGRAFGGRLMFSGRCGPMSAKNSLPESSSTTVKYQRGGMRTHPDADPSASMGSQTHPATRHHHRAQDGVPWAQSLVDQRCQPGPTPVSHSPVLTLVHARDTLLAGETQERGVGPLARPAQLYACLDDVDCRREYQTRR